MKKMALLLLALVMLVTMCACNNTGNAPTGNNSTPSTENQVQTTAASAIVDTMIPADTSVTNYMVSSEDFTQIVGELVDLSLYKDLESQEYSAGSVEFYSYYLKQENKTEYPFDFSVSFSDGTTLTMPVTFPELAQDGWLLEDSSSPDAEIEAGFMTSGICQNVSGRKIYVNAYNPTDETIPFGQCTVCKVELNMFSFYDAPGFSLSNGITHTSTLEDIVEKFGNPTSFYYSVARDGDGNYQSSEIVVTYEQLGNPSDYIEFTISGDGNYIITFEYHHLPL